MTVLIFLNTKTFCWVAFITSIIFCFITQQLSPYDVVNNDGTRSVNMNNEEIRSISHNHTIDKLSITIEGIRRRRRLSVEDHRPAIYTYYERAKTDMTYEADMALLHYWKKAWYEAGWDPRVLGEADAKRVPEYDALMDLVKDPKFIGGYNMACYKRWIAMVGVDGGFMCDYDTFPLNHFLRHGRELPYDGRLVVYERHVPALVSGNGPEYFRIVKKIGLSMQKHVYQQQFINENGPKSAYRRHVLWSDMLALSELYNISTNMFIQKFEVLNGVKALENPEWSKDDCYKANGMRAVHLSHKAINLGKQAFRGAIHRATIAQQFLNMFHATCNNTKVAD